MELLVQQSKLKIKPLLEQQKWNSECTNGV